MVDTERVVELLPHYVVMIVLMFVVLAVVESMFDNIGFWPELLVALVVVFSYRPIVVRLGLAPSSWR